MKMDMLIRNGRVIDPLRNIDEVRDIGIIGDKIVETAGRDIEATQTVDASGCYVLPGLIDFHTHTYYKKTGLGACPDFLPATGVTAAVDAGSSGCRNFPDFYTDVMLKSPVRMKAYLSCCSIGMAGPGGHEDFAPEHFEADEIARARERYPDRIIGLKLRIGSHLVRDLRPLEAAVEMAERIGGMPLCVHVTDPAGSMRDVAKLLRRGDILCHVYHGTGDTILDAHGRVLDEILKARERGVIFDVANGNLNCYHSVSIAAIREGFLPDIISTDLTRDKLNYAARARTLPFVMSKYLSFGMTLSEVVRCATATPAGVMGMEGRIGTLAPGSSADVTIVRQVKRRVVYRDTASAAYVGNSLLVPQMTVLNGEIAFGQIDFNLPEEV